MRTRVTGRWLRAPITLAFGLGALTVLPQAVLLPGAAQAHDNIVVHRRLGEESVLRLNNPFLLPYAAEVREGSYGEDVPATRSLGHFYNPETNSAPWFALGAGPATQNSQQQYNAAVTEYGNNNLTGEDAAFYRMGRALHFIQDMTSPAHTHDDQHGTDDEDFEDWGPGNINNFTFTSVVPKFAAVPTAEGYVKEIARIAYDTTAYQADIDENEGPQPASEFKSMFPSLHWEDGGFFGDDTWEVDRIGSFDCFANGVFCNDGWWMLDENLIEDNSGRGGSRRLRGHAYIENTGGNSGAPIPVIFKGVPNTTNEALLHIYGRLLYPEAIAYGAGLLQIFANQVGAPPVLTATPTAPPTATATHTPLVPVPTDTPTNTPTPTGPTATRTPTLTPTHVPLCAATPLPGCRAPIVPVKSSLSIRNKEGTFKDQLTWKWGAGAATSTGDFGDPVNGTNYTLCVYDSTGGVSSPVVSARAPGGGVCSNGRACWKKQGDNGFSYTDSLLTPDGVKKISLKAGINGKAKIGVTLKGPYLTLPIQMNGKLLQQSPQVVVQLVNNATVPVCWEARYNAPADRNTLEQFKDKGN